MSPFDYRILIWQSENNEQWYWHIRSRANGQILATSEGYTERRACMETAMRFANACNILISYEEESLTS